MLLASAAVALNISAHERKQVAIVPKVHFDFTFKPDTELDGQGDDIIGCRCDDWQLAAVIFLPFL